MYIHEVIDDIEEKLANETNSKLLFICEKYFPEENFGDTLETGMIDDVFNIILDEASSNNSFAKDIYYFLLNEKITIDEDDFYLEEELNHG